jgi:hypothetical protein
MTSVKIPNSILRILSRDKTRWIDYILRALIFSKTDAPGSFPARAWFGFLWVFPARSYKTPEGG